MKDQLNFLSDAELNNLNDSFAKLSGLVSEALVSSVKTLAKERKSAKDKLEKQELLKQKQEDSSLKAVVDEYKKVYNKLYKKNWTFEVNIPVSVQIKLADIASTEIAEDLSRNDLSRNDDLKETILNFMEINTKIKDKSIRSDALSDINSHLADACPEFFVGFLNHKLKSVMDDFSELIKIHKSVKNIDKFLEILYIKDHPE